MADRWLATIDVEHSTRVSYEASLKRYWCRRFGETIIDEIRNSEIKEVLAPLNAKTKNNTLIPMRGVLRDRVLQRHVTVGADRVWGHDKPRTKTHQEEKQSAVFFEFGGEGGIRNRVTARLDAAFRVSVTKK